MEITSLSLDLAAAGGKLRAKGIFPQISSKFYFGGSQLMGSSVSSEEWVNPVCYSVGHLNSLLVGNSE